jgi:putative ABC transport system substrate-binding protein
MKRRELIALIGGAAVTWPLAARAQQARKLPTIGILGSGSAAWSHLVSALVQRLRELGYIENRSVAIEYRWTEGRSERYAAIAAELVRLKVNAIVALGTPAIFVAKKATAVIPIVFPLASDPVGDGLVASRRLTGTSSIFVKVLRLHRAVPTERGRLSSMLIRSSFRLTLRSRSDSS